MQKKSLQTILYSTAGVLVMLVISDRVQLHRRHRTRAPGPDAGEGLHAFRRHPGDPQEARYARHHPLLLHAKRERDARDGVSQGLCAQGRGPAGRVQAGGRRQAQDREIRSAAGLGRRGLRAAWTASSRKALAGGGPSSISAWPSSARMRSRPFPSWIPTASGCSNTILDARAIVRTETPEKPTIGIMSPLPVFGMPSNPMMQQMGQQGGSQPWALVNELKNDFNVKRVGMDVDKIDDDIKLLMWSSRRRIFRTRRSMPLTSSSCGAASWWPSSTPSAWPTIASKTR
jgi:hypothetical protein